MVAARSIACLVLLAAVAGCTGSYYNEHLGSHLPKADGSMLDVDCYSSVKHAISSVSPTLGAEPVVTIVQDERTFVVTANQITLNGEPYAKVAGDAKKVRIEINAEGFEVTIDGQPAELVKSVDRLDPADPTGLSAG